MGVASVFNVAAKLRGEKGFIAKNLMEASSCVAAAVQALIVDSTTAQGTEGQKTAVSPVKSKSLT